MNKHGEPGTASPHHQARSRHPRHLFRLQLIAANLSSQTSPNFHVGPRLTRGALLTGEAAMVFDSGDGFQLDDNEIPVSH
jgi:hypothetical protein